jgi:hypothetical protein
LSNEVTKKVGTSPAGLVKDAQRLNTLCEEYRKRIEEMEKATDGESKLYSFYTYLNFFEVVGLMVRNRYIRLRDVYLLYKGPIIEIDHAFRLTILQWQQRFDQPEGLYENLLYLLRFAKVIGTRPTLASMASQKHKCRTIEVVES